MPSIAQNRQTGQDAIAAGTLVPAAPAPTVPTLPIPTADYPISPNPYVRTPLPASSVQTPDQQRLWQTGKVPQNRVIPTAPISNAVSGAQAASQTIVISKTTVGSSILLETNNLQNNSQSVLNLIAGTNTTLSADSQGGVTISSTASAGGVSSPWWVYPEGAGVSSAVITNAQWGNTQIGGTAGAIKLWPLTIPMALKVNKMWLNIQGADAVNKYDLGLYDNTGALICNIGAQTMPSTGDLSFAFTQGTVTMQPGLYWFGWTSNSNSTSFILSLVQISTIAAWRLIRSISANPAWFQSATSGSGGALASSIVLPTITTSNVLSENIAFGGSINSTGPLFALYGF